MQFIPVCGHQSPGEPRKPETVGEWVCQVLRQQLCAANQLMRRGQGLLLFALSLAHCSGGTFYTNREGTEQKRPFAINDDNLAYRVPEASTGGTAELAWRRAK